MTNIILIAVALYMIIGALISFCCREEIEANVASSLARQGVYSEDEINHQKLSTHIVLFFQWPRIVFQTFI